MPPEKLLPAHTRHWQKQPPHFLYMFCVLSAIMNLAALWILISGNHTGTSFTNFSETPYMHSPAQHAVQQRFVKFTRGIADDIPIYEHRPSADVDKAWQELYSVAENKISESEAQDMPNATWPLQRYPGHYLISLDVFHQLHCLDMLRQRIHHSSQSNYTWVPLSHIRHCIGAIRQALMCAADISPVVFQWSEERQMAEQRDDVLHVCRDFGQIRDWAREHTFVSEASDYYGEQQPESEPDGWDGHHH